MVFLRFTGLGEALIVRLLAHKNVVHLEMKLVVLEMKPRIRLVVVAWSVQGCDAVAAETQLNSQIGRIGACCNETLTWPPN